MIPLPYYSILMLLRFYRLSYFTGFVTWNVALIQLFTFVTGVMHEADNASSGAPGCVIGGSGFLTVAFNGRHYI